MGRQIEIVNSTHWSTRLMAEKEGPIAERYRADLA